MKRLLLLLLLGLSLVASSSSYAQGRFGFGFMLGEPTGFSFKYRMNRTNAIDGVLGFSPWDRFRFHADYLWQAYPFRDQNFMLHYGVGAVIGFGNADYWVGKHGDYYFVRNQDLGFGMRVPLGVDYEIPRSPVELFFELGPVLVFAPGFGAGIDVGIGVRFYP